VTGKIEEPVPCAVTSRIGSPIADLKKLGGVLADMGSPHRFFRFVGHLPCQRKEHTMKALKGLKLKPCLNCVTVRFSTPELGFRHACPCPNFSGERHWENGKIVEFLCENRKMHEGFPNTPPKTPEKPREAPRTKQSSRVHGNGLSKREIIKDRLKAIENL